MTGGEAMRLVDAGPLCVYCGRKLEGGPGGWYQVEEPQYETCDSGKSPTSFHEVGRTREQAE